MCTCIKIKHIFHDVVDTICACVQNYDIDNSGHNIRGGPLKNVALCLCPYFHQLLTDFKNFTGTLGGQFAIM